MKGYRKFMRKYSDLLFFVCAILYAILRITSDAPSSTLTTFADIGMVLAAILVIVSIVLSKMIASSDKTTE